ncbi:MAG: hypothetical protein HC831_08335 [Chloroflexia bacterium]|nr:hypothetical protein [Chloroflexia bacterium]
MPTALKSAEGLIYKNFEGNFLKSNFDFGDALRPFSGTNMLELTPNQLISKDNFCILYWLGRASAQNTSNTPATYNNTSLELRFNTGATSDLNFRLSTNNSTFPNYYYPAIVTGNSFFVGANTGQDSNGLIGLMFNTDISTRIITKLMNHNITRDQTRFDVQDRSLVSGINRIRFGKSLPYGAVITEILVLNRIPSNQELNVIFLNGNGNDYQSLEGAVAYYKTNTAEVLPCPDGLGGSVNQPGIRDYTINNNHMRFLGLPAGTNQEKVDFANSTVLIPFNS